MPFSLEMKNGFGNTNFIPVSISDAMTTRYSPFLCGCTALLSWDALLGFACVCMCVCCISKVNIL